MRQKAPERPSLAPRNWGGWLSVTFIWLLGWLPRPIGRALVWPLGPVMHALAGRRRAIAKRNLDRCFPEWTEARRLALVRQSFSALARMIVETAWCWSGPMSRFGKLGTIHGIEHLRDAEERGNGVLLVTGHATCLEIGGRILATRANFGAVYRPLRSEVMEWYQTRGRLRYVQSMTSKRNALQAVKILKRGGTVWYAPDQDFGPEQSLFAPFFGIQTATLLATHRLPAITGCAVVPMFPEYDQETRHYHVRIFPALENYPGDDPLADLARINGLIEDWVRRSPSQYWWIHRRFKTRPEGEADFYS